MLTQKAKELGLSNTKYYVDDGYTGTNFNRPAFQELLDDIEMGYISVVIVRDLSRLGRDYVSVGHYTDNYFPEHNVRFIAVNDMVDSDEGENEIAPFKNVMNEMFSLRMEALVIQYSPRIYNKSVSPVLSVRPQSAVLLSRFCQSAGEAFHGQGFPDCGTGG